MTFEALKQYLDDAGSRYGYVGTFDSCNLMIKTANGLVPVGSAQIHIGTNGVGSIILSDEEPNGDSVCL